MIHEQPNEEQQNNQTRHGELCTRDGETMRGEGMAVERLKTELLGELCLWKPGEVSAYWKQVPWPKPNPAEMAKDESNPLAKALNSLEPEVLAKASQLHDPFGWLLDAVDVSAWCDYCRTHHAPWMTRVWLAAASQLRAERRLIHKAHGWGDTREELRRHADTPDMPRYADKYFEAQLRHAKEKRRDEFPREYPGDRLSI